MISIKKIVDDPENGFDVYATVNDVKVYCDSGSQRGTFGIWGWPEVLPGGLYRIPLTELPELSNDLLNQVLMVARSQQRNERIDKTPYHKDPEMGM